MLVFCEIIATFAAMTERKIEVYALIKHFTDMKRITSAIIFSCLILSMMAQDGFIVNCKGPAPTVIDFAWAALPSLNHEDEDESGDRPWKALESAMKRDSSGLPQEKGETLTIDSKNGYIVYERVDEEYGDFISRLEVCYWNESDGKHKLIAFNNMASYFEGRPCMTEMSGMSFYRYDNATKRMVGCDPPGFEIDYSCNYELPRKGKDIITTRWNDDGTTKQTILKWDGKRFNE